MGSADDEHRAHHAAVVRSHLVTLPAHPSPMHSLRVALLGLVEGLQRRVLLWRSRIAPSSEGGCCGCLEDVWYCCFEECGGRQMGSGFQGVLQVHADGASSKVQGLLRAFTSTGRSGMSLTPVMSFTSITSITSGIA